MVQLLAPPPGSSRTYEYMSMDPMSMYANPVMAGIYPGSMANLYGGGGGKMKSSVNTDADSTSSSVGMNFNDYDDESGNYYVRRSAAAAAARRRRIGAGHQADGQDYDATGLNRADESPLHSDADDADDNDDEDPQQQQEVSAADPEREMQRQVLRKHLMVAAAERQQQVNKAAHEHLLMLAQTQVQQQEGLADGTSADWQQEHKRTKRQVYYQSGYNGKERCEGFPLEINVRSRVKMDQLFPIHGNSQIKKCIPIGRPLFPQVQNEHY